MLLRVLEHLTNTILAWTFIGAIIYNTYQLRQIRKHYGLTRHKW